MQRVFLPIVYPNPITWKSPGHKAAAQTETGATGAGAFWGDGFWDDQCDTSQMKNDEYMGVSENGVPLNPMVNDHYPY